MLYIYVKRNKHNHQSLAQGNKRNHQSLAQGNKQTIIETTQFLTRVSVTRQLIYYEGHGNGLGIYFTSICKTFILIISPVAIISIVLLRFKICYRSIISPEFIFIALYCRSYKNSLVSLLGLVLHDGGKISLTVCSDFFLLYSYYFFIF